METSNHRPTFGTITNYAVLGLLLFQTMLIIGLWRQLPKSASSSSEVTRPQSLVIEPKVDSVTPLVAAARSAFAENKAEQGVAYLSAALARRPNETAALDLYRDRLKLQFQVAIEGNEKDWELAESQVAAYDTAVRSALIACMSAAEVDSLLTRLHEGQSLLAELNSKVQGELQSVEAIIESTSPSDDEIDDAYARLRNLPTARLSEEVVSRMFDLVARTAAKREQIEIHRLEVQISDVEKQSQAAVVKLNTLRDLQNRADKLHVQIAELETTDELTQKLLARATSLRDQLDRMIQIRSLHETQTLADGDALKMVEEARRLLAAGKAGAKGNKLQPAGEKLAQAELVLGSIDRLSSLEVQQKARGLSESIRREALTIRSQQEQRYNLWAIDRLQESLADYQMALGYFRNDKEAFKRTLQEKVGVIDTQILHPATYALYQEMFQKLYGGLSNEERADITRVIELTEKMRLSDDTVFSPSK